MDSTTSSDGVVSDRSRPDFPMTTKQDLVRSARALFTSQGYAATSLDAIVAAAEVTKGALYHHFDGKKDLFVAVHRDVDTDAVRRIDAAVDAEGDPWAAASTGMHAFLDVAREPDYRRVIIQDGPAVLGTPHGEASGRTTFATVRRVVSATLTSGGWEVPDALLESFCRIMFGALSAAGAAVATSGTPDEEATRVELCVGLLVSALRQVSAQHGSLEAAVSPFVTAHE